MKREYSRYIHTHTWKLQDTQDSQQTQTEEFFHIFMNQPVLCSAFWNCMCPCHHATCSTIYLTFPSLNSPQTFLVTHMPRNFGFWGGIFKGKYLNSGLVLCFPNSLLAYPTQIWQNPCIGVMGLVKFHCLFLFV